MGIFSGKCSSSNRMDGKVAIITGANSGIGKDTAKDFVERGARVIMACRDMERAKSASKDIMDQLGNMSGIGSLVIIQLDLSSLSSVREAARKILDSESHIDVLVNNAGVFLCPFERTEEGNEMHFAVNHLGHFLFTCLLIPLILKSAPARIINVTSLFYRMTPTNFEDWNWEKETYSPFKGYAVSKMANILFTNELAEKLAGRGVTVYSVHPGMVDTDIGRNIDTIYFPGLKFILRILTYVFMKSSKQGAQTTIYCAIDDQTANESGMFYSDCKKMSLSEQARNKGKAERLWQKSVQLVNLTTDPFS